MTLIKAAGAVVALMLMSGCVVHDRATANADPHRDWWVQHHAQETYDRNRAEREHRDWCARTPDRSCEGWR